MLPSTLSEGEKAFTFFKSAGRAGVGTIARGMVNKLQSKGFNPDIRTWDFLQFCLSVCAADLACPRNTSADGWTRVIELTVGVNEPIFWQPWQKHIAEMLKVLTGDYWNIFFTSGGVRPPNGETQEIDRDCVSLLSGGLDSLIGGIDLVKTGYKPLFVSQLAHEDSERQRRYVSILGGADSHLQLSHGISFKGPRESSTRARSLAFYAFAVLAASKIKQPLVPVFIPENGFISINPPLVPGRVSSLSTRTTHPLFIQKLQELLTGMKLPIELKLPYRFKTKGQMLIECRDQTLITQLASDSTSCGRFRTYKRRHCGRCLPCMIRKSAFLAWNASNDLTDYVYPSLKQSEKSNGPDDPMAAALAILKVDKQGIDRFLGASLAFSEPDDRAHYRLTIETGIKELKMLLKRDKLL